MSIDTSDRFANYGLRAAAYIIDVLILWGIAFISLLVGIAMMFAGTTRPIGIILLIAAIIWIPSGAIWNLIIRQGKSGQTFGKSRMGIRLIRVDTEEPIGVGLALVRVLAEWFFTAITGGFFLIVDLLFPAFDKRRQRVIDKMLNTVVVNVSATASSSASSSLGGSLPPPPSDPFA